MSRPRTVGAGNKYFALVSGGQAQAIIYFACRYLRPRSSVFEFTVGIAVTIHADEMAGGCHGRRALYGFVPELRSIERSRESEQARAYMTLPLGALLT